ncbi:MAG TPA: sugar phosphate isomerase/epimerase family protein, partial [Candidatus Limnocylindrales bacterium]|nr:sugar phosphate isomerase/epimerase family protein [Candidatus Limnocylindrales bacterium]
GHPVGVTSIKDLFYLANGSTEAAVRDISAAGYAGVELFDGNVLAYEGRPDDLRRTLADAGLTLAAVYSGANFVFPDILEEEFWRIERAAGLAEAFGATNLVVGGGAKRSTGTTDEDYERLAKGLDRVVDVAGRHGLRASYHPHLTTIVEGPDDVDRILSMSRIGFCPDTAHLAAGGGDPVDLIRRHAHRVTHVHLKDFTPEPFAFQPLGRGIVDLPGVVEALRDAGYDGWATVELDDYEGAPAAAAAESIRYLQPLLSAPAK